MMEPVRNFPQHSSSTSTTAKWWYPTAFSCWGDEEREAIDRVLTSGQLTMGQKVEAFEEELAAYHGRKYAVMTNSGSSANLIMVATLEIIGALDGIGVPTVAVPALAWSTTYAPFVQLGFKLKLIDCDDTWNAKWPEDLPVDIEVVCSILGNPASHGHQLSSTYVNKPIVVEDNCESLGAIRDDGKLCGTLGFMSSFSFFYSHQISAIEGGAVLTDDVNCAQTLRMLRSHGWTKGIMSPKSFDDEYDFQLFGYNVRPVEMHAAIARAQLRKLPGFMAHRRSNALLFKHLTAGLPITHQKVNRDAVSSSFGLCFTVKDNETRSKLAAALRAVGIDCRPPTGGSLRLHRYGSPWQDQVTPNADRIHQTGMFLGNAPFPIAEKIERAVAVMKEVL
jgi:CDP-6-deoxy-D-xylo-4-hexulose-3-dehydrase